MTVPSNRLLDANAFAELEQLVEDRLPTAGPERVGTVQARRAWLDIDLISDVAAGRRLFVHATCDRSGRADVSVVARHPEPHGRDEVKRRWRWVYVGLDEGATDQERADAAVGVLRQMLPWADLRVDQEWHRGVAWVLFLAECGKWDASAGDYIWDEEADFDKWVEDRLVADPLPHATLEPSEQLLWQLELHLNDLGREVLKEDEDEVYEDAMSTIHEQDFRDAARGDGIYRLVVHEAGYQQFLGIVFESEQHSLYESLWSGGPGEDEAPDELHAAVVLADALSTEPTATTVSLFLQRFALELDRGDWEISAAELDEWLEFLDPPGLLRRRR